MLSGIRLDRHARTHMCVGVDFNKRNQAAHQSIQRLADMLEPPPPPASPSPLSAYGWA